ncbi:hypothetical protein NN4_54290 [Nocardia ninae NBRC 108245]|uniref:Uncharacterized protein n=1 Tax=Nocardia ninae NBRC 108245 TaxID=1210091 RepID=A0A511MJU9_9NOCA|nr:hypothetical protein NN4_54290 [Nocardia ninae NBRC 108245]
MNRTAASVRTFHRALSTLILALVLIFGAVGISQVAQAPSAQAAPAGYYAKNCLVKSPVSGRCDVWGAPYWINGNKLPDGKRNIWIDACLSGGTVAAVVGMFAGPQGVISGMFLGCAQGLAAAAMVS